MMGKDSEDKTERVLSIYNRLKQGKVVYKEKESLKYNVAPRTIQRDIADIQCFLQNQSTESGEIQEIVFDKKAGGYILQMKQVNQFDGKEILATTKILLESRALIKKELFPIVHKLLGLCSDETEKKLIEELLKNEMYHYVELQHGKPILDHIWMLEHAIKNHNYLEIQYQKLKNKEIVKRKVKPLGIMFSEFYFYLIAHIDCANGEEISKGKYPAIYRVDRLQSMEALEEQFTVPYTERFEEGEYRKRIQFMFGGNLKKVRLKCSDISLEAMLDRFPMAEVVKKNEGEYIVQAEVFGDGVDMWLQSQVQNVEILN